MITCVATCCKCGKVFPESEAYRNWFLQYACLECVEKDRQQLTDDLDREIFKDLMLIASCGVVSSNISGS